MQLTKSDSQFLPLAVPDLSEKEKDYVLQALDSSWISSMGEFVDRFEHEFAQACKVEHALTCSNGTAALHLALLTLGAGDGYLVGERLLDRLRNMEFLNG